MSEMMLRLLFILMLLSGLLACGGSPGKRAPAPVESRTQSPVNNAPVMQESNIQVYAYRAPQPLEPQPQVAVLQQPLLPSAPSLPSVPTQNIQPLPLAANNLLKQAKSQQQIGDYTAAASTLERSLRIAPRSAALWHELAALRAQQKRYAEVEQLAAKSNALAGNQYDLKNKNWQLIAQARTAQGDHTGAAYARQQLQP